MKNPCMVEDIEEFAPIGKSDHVGLLWTYTCKVDIATMEDDDDPKPNFNKANYDTMKNALSSWLGGRTRWIKQWGSMAEI